MGQMHLPVTPLPRHVSPQPPGLSTSLPLSQQSGIPNSASGVMPYHILARSPILTASGEEHLLVASFSDNNMGLMTPPMTPPLIPVSPHPQPDMAFKSSSTSLTPSPPQQPRFMSAQFEGNYVPYLHK
ncbi:hypothetical protein L6164_025371 [Bauhinia variegata]|uniref:Uncharacterized protein n=1 Tax=Bauhinia variegata TaxID=167791 RepID=A0ACB9M2Y6_BAUVA|nr:hypothetical protein L6164_025371 [Bauhinia variegata]